MSLINDALKRAKLAQENNEPTQVTAAPLLGPVEPAARAQAAILVWPVAIVLLFLFFAGLFFAVSAGSQSKKPMVSDPVAVAVQPVQTVAVLTTNVVKPEPVAVAPMESKVDKPTRVQGIVYDPVNPWAIISGKTVHVGDNVEGMRVTAISRDSITIAGNGQKKQLHVGEK
jgi:hypothetical protein